jgi:hypothetical protein
MMTACEVKRDEQRIQAWQAYGNSNASLTDWSGGDGAHSVATGGGQVVWMFGDTYRGFVNPTDPPSRAANEPTVANTFVVERNGVLQETRFNPLGSHTDPQTGSLFHLWPRDGVVVNGKLKVFAQRINHDSHFPPGHYGPYLVTFALPGLQRERIDVTPTTFSSQGIGWGINVFASGPYLYIYGTRTPNGGLAPSDTYVARAPLSNPLAPWEFRTSSQSQPWSSNESAAAAMARLNDGAVAQYAWNPNKYAMVGKEGTSHVFSKYLAAYISETPHGPWQSIGNVYKIPEMSDGATISYGTHFHDEDINNDGMLFSYSTCKGSGCDADGQDASIYRPRFVRIKPASGAAGSAAGIAPNEPSQVLSRSELRSRIESMSEAQRRRAGFIGQM